jgi:hypothetical protein
VSRLDGVFRLGVGIGCALAVLPLAACSGGEDGGTTMWSGGGVSLRVSSALEAGSVDFAVAEPGACLCGTQIALSSAPWGEVTRQAFRLGADDANGFAVVVLDVSQDPQLQNGNLSDDAVRSIAWRLAFPPDAERGAYALEGASIGGAEAWRLRSTSASTAGGVAVTREDWVVVRAGTQRLYALTCQYEPRRSAEMSAACEESLRSLVFES